MNLFLRFLFWPIFFLAHLLTISLLSWHLLAHINFAYPLGYKMVGIEKHIQEFAPRNNFKRDFQFTTPQEHWDLFAQITKAVQDHGKGLTDISYKLPNGTRTPLMHKAEIIHLQDVANLINKLYIIGIGSGIIWIGLLLFAYRKKMTLPSLKKVMAGFLIGIVTLVTFTISFGATKIFYWFHTKIFPDGHQWFFYYEDSLMTTLMKAPDIFAFIALLLVGLIIILWISSLWGMSQVLAVKETAKPGKKTTTEKKTTVEKKTKPERKIKSVSKKSAVKNKND